MNRSQKLGKIRIRPPRCKHVLVVLNNRLETLRLVREEIYPPIGDFDHGSSQVAVVEWCGLEVHVALDCVVFLRNVPPEPQWIREARVKTKQELRSKLGSKLKRPIRKRR